MVTAPTVVDPRQWDYEYEDQEEMIFKQNALNEYRYNFSVQLAAMCDELNIEFQYVEDTRIDITQKAGLVADDRLAVTQAKTSIDQTKIHIDQQKQAIDTTAGQVSDHAQQVADDRQLVADDKQAAADSAQAAGESAGQAEQSRQAAQDLYQDLDAVNTAKTQSQQAAQTAGEQAGLAESSAAIATEQAGIATQAAQDANVDIDEKLEGYVPRTGADLGSNDLKARLTHNSGYMYIGSYSTATYGEGQLRVWWNHNAGQLDMGGAELRNVSVRNADVTGRKAVTNMDLVGPSGTDVAASVFALQAGGRSPTIRDDTNLGRASGFYYGLSAANAPDGSNGHYFWSSYSSDDYNKYLFIRQNTANRAWIGGNHGGVWSPPAELWTTENLDITVTAGGVEFDGVLTADGLDILNGVTLRGVTDGLQITRSAGSVVIGNRNTSYTHYTSSAGKHYFYGDLHSQSGFYGNGSGLTNVNASQLNGQSRSVNDDANSIAGRDSSGDIRARLFRSTYTPTNSNIAVIYTAREADGTDFMRPSTPAQVRAALGVDVITGSNSNGRYYLYPDGRLVLVLNPLTFTASNNIVMECSATLPYPRLASAPIVASVSLPVQTTYYTLCQPLDISNVFDNGGSGTSSVSFTLVRQEGRGFDLSASLSNVRVSIETRWK
ncbi:hypothetical protein [Halomonas campaniensis]|uniref:Uncharacterized protein n=1 Tax=Halomonas campaniensis TaxID=213554 RepID=A0A246RZ35_9GAMM|nr:hypothetical protein [Halomonas campaniensis]OWV29439.1 hypothetical protein JI62_11525 [Halomonas campaniensis]